MKLIVTRRVAVGGRVLFGGDSCDVNPALARTLIAARFARADDSAPAEGVDDASASEDVPPEAPASPASDEGELPRDESASDESEDDESVSDDAEEAGEEVPGDAAEDAGDATAAPKKNEKRKRSKR